MNWFTSGDPNFGIYRFSDGPRQGVGMGAKKAIPIEFSLKLIKAAVEGRLPRGIGIERLRDPPAEWSRQFEALGLNPE